MTVYELTTEQFEELKENFLDMIYGFSDDEMDDFIKEYYEKFTFVNDDFFCTAGM